MFVLTKSSGANNPKVTGVKCLLKSLCEISGEQMWPSLPPHWKWSMLTQKQIYRKLHSNRPRSVILYLYIYYTIMLKCEGRWTNNFFQQWQHSATYDVKTSSLERRSEVIRFTSPPPVLSLSISHHSFRETTFDGGCFLKVKQKLLITNDRNTNRNNNNNNNILPFSHFKIIINGALNV